jgi:hypothetical protein
MYICIKPIRRGNDQTNPWSVQRTNAADDGPVERDTSHSETHVSTAELAEHVVRGLDPAEQGHGREHGHEHLGQPLVDKDGQECVPEQLHPGEPPCQDLVLVQCVVQRYIYQRGGPDHDRGLDHIVKKKPSLHRDRYLKKIWLMRVMQNNNQ